MKRARLPMLAMLLLCLPIASCSSFSSISRDDNGDYCLTGNANGSGFLWICHYDPKTMTLTVVRKEPK